VSQHVEPAVIQSSPLRRWGQAVLNAI